MSPLVGVTCCRRGVNFPIHQVGEKYLAAVAQAGDATPVLIPAMADALDIPTLVAKLDGLVVTGSPSDMEPSITPLTAQMAA
jgi:putative glutamine amidotransferase